MCLHQRRCGRAGYGDSSWESESGLSTHRSDVVDSSAAQGAPNSKTCASRWRNCRSCATWRATEPLAIPAQLRNVLVADRDRLTGRVIIPAVIATRLDRHVGVDRQRAGNAVAHQQGILGDDNRNPITHADVALPPRRSASAIIRYQAVVHQPGCCLTLGSQRYWRRPAARCAPRARTFPRMI